MRQKTNMPKMGEQKNKSTYREIARHARTQEEDGETTFNLQTPSVFIDIRVPKAGAALLGHHGGFHTMTVR